MTKTSEGFLTKILLFVKKSKQENKTQLYIQKNIKRQIDALPFATPRQKSELFKRVMHIVRNGYTGHGYRMLLKTMNFVERRCQTAAKLTVMENKMSMARTGGGEHGQGIKVFYLCSVHTGPAADHKEWQGKIYVDRQWKSVLTRGGSTGTEIRGIEAYIKNHQILTVQEVVNNKPYLLTRPYCRHFFIPLSTAEVLGSSLNKILKEHPEAHTHSRSKPISRTRRQYRRMKSILD